MTLDDLGSADRLEILKLIGVGWAVWERLPGGADHYPRGGTVVEVYRDPETGYPAAFEVVDSPHGRIRLYRLNADDLDLDLAQMPNAATVRSRARQMQAAAGASKGAVTEWDLRLSSYALTLLASIA